MKQHASNEGIRLKNWSTGEVLYDKLHSTSNVKALNCRLTICTANHMNTYEEHLNRCSEIKMQIEDADGYITKTKELKYGATVAWRNAPSCPGRIQWKKDKCI
ncbi:hypothetical protein QYM36_018597 [Artemia franciscana]|uniref:nitric-oxide synthase (NADPH) n=1 Tax=Artemia franciscana TaxID=6661 RepID=A0AA88H247_ARTSF|nr:hypothetical protein QYM36_018597 [Artemia franciscana]